MSVISVIERRKSGAKCVKPREFTEEAPLSERGRRPRVTSSCPLWPVGDDRPSMKKGRKGGREGGREGEGERERVFYKCSLRFHNAIWVLQRLRNRGV
jgi:hypothetical protein